MSVTMIDTSSWTPAERQAAAREAYRASGYRLSGAELGRRFGRSGRWGRAQIEAVATEDRSTAGSHGQEDSSPVAATVGAIAAGKLRTAATGSAVRSGAPSTAGTGSIANADGPQVAAAGGTAGVQRADAAADVADAGSGVLAVAATASVRPATRSHRRTPAATPPSPTCQQRCAGHQQAP